MLWLALAATGLIELLSINLGSAWNFLAGSVFSILLLDMLLGFKRPSLTVTRKVHSNLPVAAWSTITLHIKSVDRSEVFLAVYDHTAPDFATRNLPEPFFLVSRGNVSVSYQVKPGRRGLFTFPGTDIFIRSPFRLWQKKCFFPCKSETKVFPNFKEISHYTLLATHHNLSLMGIRKLIRRGEGKEFHQLREYRKGDELQKIDWKATSRQGRLISREYQDERDQQILFMLDCGRRMAHTENERRLIDEALNSVLLLTYVASRQGDSIGLHSFGGTDKSLPPRKHGDSVRSMLLAMYDIEASPVTADYLRASQEVLKLQSRRALIIIVTNSRLEDHDDLLQSAIQLRKKHLVVCANLRESVLEKEKEQPVTSLNDALRYQAMQHYLAERKKLATQLAHRGIIFLDVTAQQLPSALVNSYLDIKSSGRL